MNIPQRKKKFYTLQVYDQNRKSLTHSLNQLIYKDSFENSNLDSGIYYNYSIPLDT